MLSMKFDTVTDGVDVSAGANLIHIAILLNFKWLGENSMKIAKYFDFFLEFRQRGFYDSIF